MVRNIAIIRLYALLAAADLTRQPVMCFCSHAAYHGASVIPAFPHIWGLPAADITVPTLEGQWTLTEHLPALIFAHDSTGTLWVDKICATL